jgi:hypothetical protein
MLVTYEHSKYLLSHSNLVFIKVFLNKYLCRLLFMRLFGISYTFRLPLKFNSEFDDY